MCDLSSPAAVGLSCNVVLSSDVYSLVFFFFEWYAIVLDERRYKLTGKSSRRLMGDGTSERLTKGERR